MARNYFGICSDDDLLGIGYRTTPGMTEDPPSELYAMVCSFADSASCGLAELKNILVIC